MPSSLERFLTEPEIDYLNNVTVFGSQIISYRGKLDIEAMRVAYRTLVDRYPVLRARIEERPEGLVLCAPEGHYPTFMASEGDREALLRQAEALHETRNGAISSLLVVHNELGGFVLFLKDHLIVAAGSAFIYNTSLWQLYTEIVSGAKSDYCSVNKLPEPGDKFTPVPPSKALGGGVSNEDSLYLRKSEPLQKVSAQWFDVSLEDFHRIKRACRAHDIGVGNYMGGVMATVLRDRNSRRGKMPMNFLIAIDHAAGRVNFTDVTCSIVRHRIQIDIDLRDSPFSVASQLAERVDKARVENVFFDDFELGDQDLQVAGYGKVVLNLPDDLETDFYNFTNVLILDKPGKLIPFDPKPHADIMSISFGDQLRVLPICRRVDEAQHESVRDEFMRSLISTK